MQPISNIHPGLVSVTFRQLSVKQIVELVVQAQLEGIEWGGDVHVPPGQLQIAKETGVMTADAGLQVAAYGSYYRVGVSPAAELSFSAVLETALALRAPTIRVWAGNRASAQADAAWWDCVVQDGQRIADLAALHGLKIAFEHHGGTLTDTAESALRLQGEIGRANSLLYWQPPLGQSVRERVEGLRQILPVLSHLHVFHWTHQDKGIQRHPLGDAAGPWQRYLKTAGRTGKDHFALLEFVAADSPEQFLVDAAVLRSLCGNLENR